MGEPYRKQPADERRTEYLSLNTSLSCAPNAGGHRRQVGCDVGDERYSVRVFGDPDTDRGSWREAAVK